MTDREYIKSDMKAFMRELLESLKGQGYSPYLKSKDNPQGKTDGLTSKTLNKILMRIAKGEDNDEVLESLRDWFKKEKWVRISSSGNIAGPCGTSKNKKNPDRCLPKAKAQSLSKSQRAATARKKKKAGANGKTVVKNTKAATVKREGYYSNTQLEDEIRQYGYDSFEQFFADNPGAEEAVFDFIDQNLARIQKETADPQDGKAAPYGSGYKPIKKMKKEDIQNLVVGLIHEAQGKEVLMEKDDRCTRLAKQKYDTWPSAYASGAVVRCRRGEIWKKK